MIFVDSSFLFAGFDRRDSFHETARRLGDLVEDRQFVTTSHVRGELWTLVRRRLGHHAAVVVLDSFVSGWIQVAAVDAGLEEEALAWLRHRDEREYSFVDATSFAFMRANGIREALAFDGDFAAAGFTELRPDG